MKNKSQKELFKSRLLKTVSKGYSFKTTFGLIEDYNSEEIEMAFISDEETKCR